MNLQDGIVLVLAMGVAACSSSSTSAAERASATKHTAAAPQPSDRMADKAGTPLEEAGPQASEHAEDKARALAVSRALAAALRECMVAGRRADGGYCPRPCTLDHGGNPCGDGGVCVEGATCSIPTTKTSVYA